MHDLCAGLCRLERTRQQGFFRAPLEGQSLLSFLSSQDFHTCTDLERVSFLSGGS